jgi:hypothetical protein
MAEQLGRLTARLAESRPELSDSFLDLINRRIAPTTQLTAEHVYIAAMYLVSDQVNSFGGRFPIDEHPRIAQLLIDSPVLVGHRKDHLPIARNFHAELVEREGEKWVKCYFYWLRGPASAELLKANIEGGIYKECSIAFTYNLPECSICGQDIRICEHEPGQSYPASSGPAECHFNYRQIERVLETSLVYRGAVPNTLVTTENADKTKTPLSPDSAVEPRCAIRLLPLASLAGLDNDTRYLVLPRYTALPVAITTVDGKTALTRLDQSPLPQHLNNELGLSSLFESPNAVGLLIGYQGRQRCSRELLEKYLTDKSGPVSRIVLAFYPDTRRGVRPTKHTRARCGTKTLPYRVAALSNLPAAIKQMSTRDGVEIWPLSADPLSDIGYLYNPSRSLAVSNEPDKCGLRVAANLNTAILSLTVENRLLHFDLRDFTSKDYNRGRQFLADLRESDLSTGELPSSLETTLDLPVAGLRREGDGFRISLGSRSDKAFGLRPVILNGRRRFLLQQFSQHTIKESANAPR